MTAESARPLRAGLACACLVLALAPAAFAQSDVDRAAAREHFTRGVDLIHQARWLEAITELQAARQIRVTAPVLFNLGLAQRAVGRSREAIVSFRAFIQLAQGRNADLVAQAEGYVREIEAAASHLDLRIEPRGADVQIDGAVVRVTDGPIEIDPGRHVVLTQAEGFAPDTRTVDVRPGAATVVAVRLVPREGASRVVIDSNVASAEIRIDGVPVGLGAAEETVRPGHHAIEVRASGHATFRREFEARPAGDVRVHANLADNRTVLSSPWFWIGAGAVVVAAGVVTGVLLSGTDAPVVGTWGLVDQSLTAGARH